MKKWIARWNAYWFPTTTTTALALTRIIAVAAQLFWFFPSLRYQLNLLEKNSEFIEPQLLIRAITAIVPRDVLFTPCGCSVFCWVTVAAGLAALVGLLPGHPFRLRAGKLDLGGSRILLRRYPPIPGGVRHFSDGPCLLPRRSKSFGRCAHPPASSSNLRCFR